MNHSKALILKDGEFILNTKALLNAALNTNWNSAAYRNHWSGNSEVKTPPGAGRPIENQEQIFVLKINTWDMNSWLHDPPGSVTGREDLPVFDDYDKAMKHARSFSTPVSVWQYCESKFELIHPFVKGKAFIPKAA